MNTSEQRDAVRLDYGLSKYASLADAMDGAIREIANLRAANSDMRSVLETIVRVADTSIWSGKLIVDESSPLIEAARDALALEAAVHCLTRLEGQKQ